MKKLLPFLISIVLISCSVQKSRTLVHPYTGQTTNDHTGDPIKVAFDKVNAYLTVLDRLRIEEILSTPDEINITHNMDTKVLSVSAVTTIPTIYSAAGDTSNYPIPGKIGNYFYNTSDSTAYYSISSNRGGWVKIKK
jgi:hypothetical protein